MNLTLLFFILSIAIGYMLYDTFKKSRQQQNQQQQPKVSKIKLNYAKECRILKQLHQQKLNSLSFRSVSIHFGEKINENQQQQNNEQSEKKMKKIIDEQTLNLIKIVLKKLQKICNVFLVECSEDSNRQLHQIINQCLPPQNIIHCKTIEGGVAVLRQLNCELHLETGSKMLSIIKQYIKNIWTTIQNQVVRQFPNQQSMLISLDSIINSQGQLAQVD